MRGMLLLAASVFATLPVAANSDAGRAGDGKQIIIPTRFQGVWDADHKACAAAASDMRLYVGSGRFRFVDTVGQVQRVRRRDDRSITVFASHLSEGETWEDQTDLTLSPAGDELTVRNGDSNVIRVRCTVSS